MPLTGITPNGARPALGRPEPFLSLLLADREAHPERDDRWHGRRGEEAGDAGDDPALRVPAHDPGAAWRDGEVEHLTADRPSQHRAAAGVAGPLLAEHEHPLVAHPVGGDDDGAWRGRL